jgi:hypothetical protein
MRSQLPQKRETSFATGLSNNLANYFSSVRALRAQSIRPCLVSKNPPENFT